MREVAGADELTDLLMEWDLAISVAESCTGGLLAKVLTDRPGSSRYFLGGIVAYSNRAKEELLGVSPDALERFGAVSREVAGEMAAGAAASFGADIGLAITGIAGPGGATETKPVGLVYIAVARGERLYSEELTLQGGRPEIREGAVAGAVELVAKVLMGKV